MICKLTLLWQSLNDVLFNCRLKKCGWKPKTCSAQKTLTGTWSWAIMQISKGYPVDKLSPSQMSVTTPTGIFIINSTFFLPGWKLACCPAHVHKGIEVSFQTLISLPLQSGKSSELGPVKCLPLRVIHHPKWWYCAVKICLFSTSPPKRSQKNTNDW